MGIVEAKGKYVTYIEEYADFDKTLMHVNLDTIISAKPQAAWWGSPVNATYGWKELCKDHNYDNYNLYNPIYWSLKPGSKILQIGLEDVTNINKDSVLLKYIDFKRGDYLKLFNLPDDQKSIVLLGLPTDMDIEDKLKFIKRNYLVDVKLNFHKIVEDGIAAVELMDCFIGHYFKNKVEEMFYSWECESIAVLDLDKIIFEEGDN